MWKYDTMKLYLIIGGDSYVDFIFYHTLADIAYRRMGVWRREAGSGLDQNGTVLVDLPWMYAVFLRDALRSLYELRRLRLFFLFEASCFVDMRHGIPWDPLGYPLGSAKKIRPFHDSSRLYRSGFLGGNPV